MPKHAKTSTDEPESNFAWGALAIGKVINRTASQVHYLHEQGLLGDATFKLGHRTLVGDIAKLRDLKALASNKI
jgi:hypothetical protein